MRRKDRDSKLLLRSSIAAAVASVISGHAAAVDYEFGDGWGASWDNSMSIGTAWRARNPDPKLYSKADGLLVGRGDGMAPNTTDEGTLNYGRGAQFTTLFKWITELQVQKGEMGALVRAKAWYDYTLNKQNVRYGNQANGYNGFNGTALTDKRPLSDDGFGTLNRFDGVYLLDAYVYNTFEVADKPLQVRVGNQVVNWGESLFIQGINQINPIDVPSFHKPGAQLKEVLLPVPIIYANQGLGDLGSLEFFYQAQWKATPIDMNCGNYWSLVGANMSTSVGPCNNMTSPFGGSQPLGTLNKQFIYTEDSRKPSNYGQFGAAYRFNAPALDTEFGLYGMRYHSRTPYVSLVNVGNGQAKNGMPFDATWDYPEAIKAYGLSAATNILGWSVAGETSLRQNVPVQIDGNDVLFGGLGLGPYGSGGKAVSGANGGNGYLQGYTRTNIKQIQVNAVKAGNRLLGGDQYVFVAEAAAQWNSLPNYKHDANALRYNRAFIFGAGSALGYGGSTCGTLNTTAEGCANDGYVSKFAWGYRLKMDVTYNDVFAGVAVTPSVFWSHDVRGYSADGQFNEDREALGLGVKFSYNRKYTLDLGATMFNRSAKYDPMRDRDFYSATMSVAF